MKTKFFLIRHGETEANLADIISGHLETPLTKLGREQAQARAKDFIKINFAAVYSSDLTRAQETAEILVGKKLKVQTDERLRERFYAELDGLIVAKARIQYADRFALRETLTREERIEFRLAEGVENDVELMARLTKFLFEKAIEHSNKNVLVVAHGDLLRSFLMWVGEYQYGQLQGGSVDNLGYVVVEVKDDKLKVAKQVGVKPNSHID